ncbi:MAG: type II toxin-antitoxin system mRNA interferase toxin, RelE/StbE family [Campylobacteraceae bacterium]|nr:type II toxin-antitoxin system mRNA interferase toxin, RelE/StbE family [Campylobacteraceae bacterium]
MKLVGVIAVLRRNLANDENYKGHELKGDYASCRGCHIKQDLLLII